MFSTLLKLPYLCLLLVFHERRLYPDCCYWYHPGCCYWYHPSCCSEAFVFFFLDAPCWLLRCVHERWRALEPMLSMFVIFSHRLLYVNDVEQLLSRLSFCKCTHSRHEGWEWETLSLRVKFGFCYCLQIWGRSLHENVSQVIHYILATALLTSPYIQLHVFCSLTKCDYWRCML